MLVSFLSFLKTALDFSIYLKATLDYLNDLEVTKICVYIIYIYVYIYIDK